LQNVDVVSKGIRFLEVYEIQPSTGMVGFKSLMVRVGKR